MIVRCPDCGRAYDDAQRWTICPHHPLGSDPKTGAGYCRKHDLFACYICKADADEPNA